MPGRPDVLVIGAGLVGLAVSRELAGRGLAVELLEAKRIGSGSSSAGAGLLSPISDWDSTRPFIEICRRARDEWKGWLAELVEESGVAVEFDDSGALLIGLTAEDDAGIDAEAAIARDAGEDWSELAVAEARAMVPDLSAAARRVARLPGEHRVDNVAACAALAAACRERGVRIREGFQVVEVRPGRRSVAVAGTIDGIATERQATTLVVASGAWSGAIAGLPGLPVRPVRGQMLRLAGAAWPWAGSVRLRHNYCVRRGRGGLLVGATVEEAGFEAHPTVDGIASLLDFSRALFPTLSEAPVVSIWAGLRPGSPDGRPILGRIDDSNVVAACGHYRNGILLAPWTGRVVADLVAEGKPVESFDLFSVERFATARG